MNEDVRALKDALQNLNARKSTSRIIVSEVFCRKILKVMNLSKTLSSNFSVRGVLHQHDKQVKNDDCERKLSPTILIYVIKWYTCEIRE